MRRGGACAALLLVAAGTVAAAAGQLGRGLNWWRTAAPRAPAVTPLDRDFTFCRIAYTSVRRESGGYGWSTDYPTSDANFMTRLSELTTATISRRPTGEPNHVVLQLSDPALFRFPFIFMSDVGTAAFSDEEASKLREYLIRGGFLWVDDFWGPAAWASWEREIASVLPPAEYPIVDLPMSHPIFRGMFQIEQAPQIPSIQFWRRSRGATTSERGGRSAEPHFRGIADASGRLMVLMTHDTDIADGWEREGEDSEYFHRFSVDAYAVGFNVLLYAMAH